MNPREPLFSNQCLLSSSASHASHSFGGDRGFELLSLKTAASRKVFRVLQAYKVCYAKFLPDDSCSPHQALQLWFRGLFSVTPTQYPQKIEKCNIVDTPFHGFCRIVARWVLEAASPHV